MKLQLPITNLKPLLRSVPADLRLVVADVGSVGGLHKRWRWMAPNLVTINFDPLDPRSGSAQALNFPVLIGDREGEARLQVTSRPSMSSTLDPNPAFFAPFWRKPADIEVVDLLTARMTTLDALLAAEGLTPDALKIDVQGGEGAVLDGAAQALGR